LFEQRSWWENTLRKYRGVLVVGEVVSVEVQEAVIVVVVVVVAVVEAPPSGRFSSL